MPASQPASLIKTRLYYKVIKVNPCILRLKKKVFKRYLGKTKVGMTKLQVPMIVMRRTQEL